MALETKLHEAEKNREKNLSEKIEKARSLRTPSHDHVAANPEQ